MLVHLYRTNASATYEGTERRRDPADRSHSDSHGGGTTIRRNTGSGISLPYGAGRARGVLYDFVLSGAVPVEAADPIIFSDFRCGIWYDTG